MMSSALSAPPMANRTTIPYGFLLVVIGLIAILVSSSIFTILPSSPPLLSNQPSAFATFAGENGKITFDSNRASGNYDIYVMNADGSEQTRLTTDPGLDEDPNWSPDGTKIAFNSIRDGNREIYVMNADGSEQTRLTNNPTIDTTPDWSPDGEKIVFRRGLESGNPEIYIMNAADGSEQTNISNNPAIDFDPSWSLDGTKIAFTSYRVGFSEIFVMNAADGSEQTNISNNRGSADGHPDWGTATSPEEDTTPPIITVPDDIAEEASSADGAEVSFEVSAEDDVDGAVDVSCDYDSGDTFPIGETVLTCSAEDAAGNAAEESFTIMVQDTTPPDVEITEAVDRRRSTEIPDGGTTPIPYIRITFEATDAVGIDETECSLDGQQTSIPCTSPTSYDRLSRGTHEFTVRVTDEAGNTGEDEFTWTVNNPSAAAPGRQ